MKEFGIHTEHATRCRVIRDTYKIGVMTSFIPPKASSEIRGIFRLSNSKVVPLSCGQPLDALKSGK